MALQLQFIGKVFRIEGCVHGTNVIRFVEVRITIGAVYAAEGKRFRNALNAEEFDRRQYGRECRIRVSLVEIKAIVEAAQHPCRITLASLLLDPQTVVLFTEIERHQIESGRRGRLEAQ